MRRQQRRIGHESHHNHGANLQQKNGGHPPIAPSQTLGKQQWTAMAPDMQCDCRHTKAEPIEHEDREKTGLRPQTVGQHRHEHDHRPDQDDGMQDKSGLGAIHQTRRGN